MNKLYYCPECGTDAKTNTVEIKTGKYKTADYLEKLNKIRFNK